MPAQSPTPPPHLTVPPSAPGLPAPEPVTLDWGRTRYEAARRMQDALVAQRIENRIPDTLVLTKHDPVFTIGLF